MTFSIISVDATAFVSRLKVFASGVQSAERLVVAIVDHVALFKTVSVEVFFAHAVIANGAVDAGRVFVTFIVTGFAFVDRADERVVIAREPSLPLCAVNWITKLEDVIEQGFNAGKQIRSIRNIMEIDQLTGNCTRLHRALSTVSLDILKMRSGNTVFLNYYYN